MCVRIASGYLSGALDASLIALPILCLSFYAGLWIRRSRRAVRQTGHDVTLADRHR